MADHGERTTGFPPTLNAFQVRGEFVSFILTRKSGPPLECIFSLSKLDKWKSFGRRWYAHWAEKGQTFYAYTQEFRTRRKIYLHRFLTDAPSDKVVDHWDHNGLNCLDENLRLVSMTINGHNRRGLNQNNRSGARGVRKNHSGSWVAAIKYNYEFIHIGSFRTRREATAAYQAKAIELGIIGNNCQTRTNSLDNEIASA